VAATIIRTDGSRAPVDARARRRLLHAGAPETAIRAAEAHGHHDWTPLAHAMDRMFMVGYGHLSQRRFWFTRHPRLGGLSPIEAMAQPGGVDSVFELARVWARPRNPFM
jgi:hypothetical protein